MFSLSTRARYALRIMVYLAAQNSGTFTKQVIAEHEDIPSDYVAQILVRLRAAGFVMSRRGAQGGFDIAVDPRKTTVLDLLLALEGPIRVATCQEQPCQRSTRCATEGVWAAAKEALEKTFAEYTLAQLAEQARAIEQGTNINFDI